MKKIDLSGQKFNRLLVIEDTGKRRKNGTIIWLCKCDCGNFIKTSKDNLDRATKSCGCLQKEITGQRSKGNSYCLKHGHWSGGKASRTWKSWNSMKHRCLNENAPNYKYYGGRGITICDRWLNKNGFENFLEDMGERPEGTSIDRVDNEGNYQPSNCKWSTPKEQINNRRI